MLQCRKYFFYIDLYCRFLEMWYLFKCIFFYTFRRLRFILNLIGDFLNQSSKQNSNFNRWVKYFSQYKLLSSKCKLNIFEIIYIFLPKRKKIHFLFYFELISFQILFTNVEQVLSYINERSTDYSVGLPLRSNLIRKKSPSNDQIFLNQVQVQLQTGIKIDVSIYRIRDARTWNVETIIRNEI